MVGDRMTWFVAPKPATLEQISAIEGVLGRRFPDDFREFAQRFSGGSPNESDFEFADVETGTFFASIGRFLTFMPEDDGHLLEFRSRTEFFPQELVPFAADGGGNLICFNFRDDPPPIVFWHHGRGGFRDEVSLVAQTFSEFIGLLHAPDDDLPSNSRGRIQVTRMKQEPISPVVSNGIVVDEERPGWSLFCPACQGAVRYTFLNLGPGPEPFLYSDTTPDFVLRDEDASLLGTTTLAGEYPGVEDIRSIYERLEAALDLCPTGGRFRLWSNVRCPLCLFEFPYNHGIRSEELRLFERKIIWVEGAIAFRGPDMPGNRLKVVRTGD